VVLLSVMTIADEVDWQLGQAMDSFVALSPLPLSGSAAAPAVLESA